MKRNRAQEPARARDAAIPEEDPAKVELRALTARLRMLGVFLLSAALDLLFLGIWTLLHAVARRTFAYLGAVGTFDGF